MKDRILSLFDYVFYRAYRFAKTQTDTPVAYASGIVFVIQSFSILSLSIIVRLFVDFPMPGKLLVIPGIILLMALNWIRYERESRIEEMKLKWENEDQQLKLKRGWLIVVSIFLLIVIPLGMARIYFLIHQN